MLLGSHIWRVQRLDGSSFVVALVLGPMSSRFWGRAVTVEPKRASPIRRENNLIVIIDEKRW